MFGLPSLGKILVLVAIVVAVWYGFKLLGQFDRHRKDLARQASARRAGRGGAVEDMVHCQTCGIYLPTGGATSCGKAGCPF